MFAPTELVNENQATRKDDRWGTDRRLITVLKREREFGIDLAAERVTRVCEGNYEPMHEGYYGPDHVQPMYRDALVNAWTKDADVGFLNPPFSLLPAFIEKVWQERLHGFCTVAVLPVKAEQPWWHEFVPLADEVRFLKGRLRYIDPETNELGQSARFASAVIIWDGRKPLVTGGPRISWWDWRK